MTFAEKLTVDASASPALTAFATDTASGKQFTGTLSGDGFVFDLKAGRHYDVTLKSIGGQQIKLIDLAWYNHDAPADSAEPLGDDDRQAITEVMTGIARFTNHNQIVAIAGNSDRAVVLLDLRRDSAFHSDQGGEIIRRIEVWYFKNQAGGWAKVPQQDRLIDRQRFTSAEEFLAVYDKETWQPMPAGLSVEHGMETTVKVDFAATTRPAK